MSSKGIVLVIWGFLVLVITAGVVSAEINVSLTSPPDNFVFNSTNNITFNCSVLGESYLKNVSLYHDINGSFTRNQTFFVGEHGPDSHTEFLCHFNGGLECYGGNISSLVTPDSVSYESAKFYEGLLVNDSDELAYNFDTTFDRGQGTIEVWIKKTSALNVNSGTYYIVEVGKPVYEEYNEFQIYIENGFLYFSVFDSTDSSTPSHYVRRNVSFFQDGHLYHIVGVWDLDLNVSGNHRLELYINSSNANNEYSGTDVNITMDGTPDSVSVGVWKGMYGSQFNSVIDELRILDYVLSPSEINESYQRFLTNSTNVSFTLNNIPDGTYVWNCLAYDNESRNNWSSSNYTFSIDLQTPPTVNYILLSPSSLDDIDPGVTINVTANVTDVSNVSFVLFQYKEYLGYNWTNRTMENTGGNEWKANFTTVDNERIYYYRVCSNDTLGHWGCSDTYNVSVMWDYTWVANDSNVSGVKSGLVNTFNELGILVINNTGDDTLVFTITDNWDTAGDCGLSECEVLYNGSSETYQFSLPNKSVEYVNITALFEDHDSETNMTINISAVPSAPGKTASPENRSIIITMNSYTGGPYFNVYILSPPTTVYQSGTFNLTAKVKNIGNESATNTWLNWSLPDGWNVIEGNESNNLSVLGSSEIRLNNITVYIDPNSAYAGTYEIIVNVSCSKNRSGNASAVIGVECNDNDGVCGAGCSYVTDSDCSVPGGGGGTTDVKAYIKEEPDFEISAPERIDINRGETINFTVLISNPTKRYIIERASISLSGYPAIHIKITPSILTNIKSNESGTFLVNIYAPVYAVYHEYGVVANITAVLTDKTSEKRVTKSSKILLVTHKVIESETEKYLLEANRSVHALISKGFEASDLLESLKKAEEFADEGRYDEAKELAKEIMKTQETAFRVFEKMSSLEKQVEEIEAKGFVMSETRKGLYLAKSAFERGDYGRADKRVESAMFMYSMEFGTLYPLIFIHDYWAFILGAFATSGVAAAFSRKRLLTRMLKNRILSLEKEKSKIFGLIKKLEKDYFVHRAVSEKMFAAEMEGYMNELVNISNRKIENIRKLVVMFKPEKARGFLRREEGKIRKFIENLQKEYFVSKSMSREYYEKLSEVFIHELAFVEEMMDEFGGSYG